MLDDFPQHSCNLTDLLVLRVIPRENPASNEEEEWQEEAIAKAKQFRLTLAKYATLTIKSWNFAHIIY